MASIKTNLVMAFCLSAFVNEAIAAPCSLSEFTEEQVNSGSAYSPIVSSTENLVVGAAESIIEEIVRYSTVEIGGGGRGRTDGDSCYGSHYDYDYERQIYRDVLGRLLGHSGSKTKTLERAKDTYGWDLKVIESYTCSWKSASNQDAFCVKQCALWHFGPND